jgi:hypothetical protein
MKVRLSGEIIKDAAGMVSEFEEGNSSVEEWCDADERKRQEYSSKET